jgi:hypothetical protein
MITIIEGSDHVIIGPERRIDRGPLQSIVWQKIVWQKIVWQKIVWHEIAWYWEAIDERRGQI